MGHRRAYLVATAAAALLAAPAAAQNFPCAETIPPDFFQRSERVYLLEAEEERVSQRVLGLKRAAAQPAKLAGQRESLEWLAQARREAVAQLGDQTPAGEILRQRDQLALAEGLLAMSREAASGRISGDQVRQAEGDFAATFAATQAARADHAALIRNNRECLIRAGQPLTRWIWPLDATGVIDIIGRWEASQLDGGWRPVDVGQSRQQISFFIDDGPPYLARLEGQRLISDMWRGGMAGQVAPDGSQIRWDNGMIWRRVD